jgi:hypothetical protein
VTARLAHKMQFRSESQWTTLQFVLGGIFCRSLTSAVTNGISCEIAFSYRRLSRFSDAHKFNAMARVGLA